MAEKVTIDNFNYKEQELASAFALSIKNIVKFGDTDYVASITLAGFPAIIMAG